MPIRLIQMSVLLLAGGLYWQTVVWVTGANEPWDAHAYWHLWYPISLLMSAFAGPFVRQSPWQAGLLLTLAQLQIMWLNSGVGPLMVFGLAYLLALAIPAMAISQITGWLWRLIFTRHNSQQSRQS